MNTVFETISQESPEESNGSDTLVLQIKVPRKVMNWLTEVAKFRQSSSIVRYQKWRIPRR